MNYHTGDTVYITENNQKVTKAEVLKAAGDMYTLRLESGALTRLREGRLYATRDHAERAIKRRSR